MIASTSCRYIGLTSCGVMPLKCVLGGSVRYWSSMGWRLVGWGLPAVWAGSRRCLPSVLVRVAVPVLVLTLMCSGSGDGSGSGSGVRFGLLGFAIRSLTCCSLICSQLNPLGFGSKIIVLSKPSLIALMVSSGFSMSSGSSRASRTYAACDCPSTVKPTCLATWLPGMRSSIRRMSRCASSLGGAGSMVDGVLLFTSRNLPSGFRGCCLGSYMPAPCFCLGFYLDFRFARVCRMGGFRNCRL